MKKTALATALFIASCSSGAPGSGHGSNGAGTPDMTNAGDGGGGGAGGGGPGGGDGGIGGGGGGGQGGGGGGGSAGGLMQFAVFGDCRPPSQTAPSRYPSAVLSGVFKLAQQKAAQFVVGTGDYMFA